MAELNNTPLTDTDSVTLRMSLSTAVRIGLFTWLKEKGFEYDESRGIVYPSSDPEQP